MICLPEPYRVCEGGKNTELEFLLGVVAGYIQESSSGKFLLVHFEVGGGSVASHTPVDETVCPINSYKRRNISITAFEKLCYDLNMPY